MLSHFIAGYSSPSSSTTSSPQQQVLQSAPSPVALRKRPVADDTDGHLAYLPGDILGDRYEIISTLGKNISTTILVLASVCELQIQNLQKIKMAY